MIRPMFLAPALLSCRYFSTEYFVAEYARYVTFVSTEPGVVKVYPPPGVADDYPFKQLRLVRHYYHQRQGHWKGGVHEEEYPSCARILKVPQGTRIVTSVPTWAVMEPDQNTAYVPMQ